MGNAVGGGLAVAVGTVVGGASAFDAISASPSPGHTRGGGWGAALAFVAGRACSVAPLHVSSELYRSQ